MRAIYRILASQYDPLGYIAPFTTLAKVLVRDLWTQESSWDDPLPPGEVEELGGGTSHASRNPAGSMSAPSAI